MDNNIHGFSRRGATETNQNDIEIITLSSDDDAEVAPPPPPPINSSAQSEIHHIKTEIVHDSVDINASQFDGYQNTVDNGQMIPDHYDETYNTESSSPSSEEFIPNLKTKYRYDEQKVQYSNAQTGTRYLMDTARTLAPSPTAAAAASPMVTSTTAPMMSSTPSPLPNPNFSNESLLSNFQSCTSQVSQNITNNLSFNDLFKDTTGAGANQAWELIQSTIKQQMQVAMENLMQNYDIKPKNSGAAATAQQKIDADSKSKKGKRKHRHLKSEKNADDRHRHEHRQSKKERFEGYSSSSSLTDLFGPSTSTPKPSGKIKNLLFFVTFCLFEMECISIFLEISSKQNRQHQ